MWLTPSVQLSLQKKRIRIKRIDFVCQVAGPGRGYAFLTDSKQYLVKKGRVIVSSWKLIRHIGNFGDRLWILLCPVTPVFER